MKKRGFTLVELLAVIVILAIIALIAVPVFLGIINNSKKSSDKEGVNLYTDTVEKAIQKKQMSDPNFMPDKCTIKTDGNLECFSGATSLGTVKVSMKGTKPSSGTIYIKEDDITYENIVLNGKKYYKKASSATLVNDAAPTGVSYGDKYTYKVNDTDTFNFYVLSVEGDKVNLIMDRNICSDGTVNYTEQNNYCNYKWYSATDNNTYGPTTVMQELYAGTKDWDNVSDMIMNYTDENNGTATDMGYTSIITSNGVTTITGKPASNITTVGTSSKPLKARLPKESEVIGAGCIKGGAGTCPTWLMENITYENVANDSYPMNNNTESYQNQIYGYWLLSSYPGSSAYARGVHYYGLVHDGKTTYGGYGVRPVITVSKSDLQ